MRLNLQCHPDTPSSVARAIEVELSFADPGKLHLEYRIFGDHSKLEIPPVEAAVRADNLWKSTCLELFVLQPDTGSYSEYNFSPSSQWAAYVFSDYRSGMEELLLSTGPDIQVQTMEDGFVIRVTVDVVESLVTSGKHAGISAVVKTLDGSTSYWALAHPEGSPDFHHRDCFIYQLKAA